MRENCIDENDSRENNCKEESDIMNEEMILFKFEQLKNENENIVEKIRECSDRCLKAMYVSLLILTLLLT